MERPEPKFGIGARARLAPRKANVNQALIGQTCVVLRAEWFDDWQRGLPPGWGYLIDLAVMRGITDLFVHEQDLQPLPPDEKTQWDASIWQPKEVTA